MARYYRADLERNAPVSTEITGYAASVLVYLHQSTGDARFLARAEAAARFLARDAWDRTSRAMPFELSPGAPTYFFDCGIIVRGLLAAWRATGSGEFLDVAAALGQAMAEDFAVSQPEEFHPVLSLPEKHPLDRDALRWSRSPGCYQLKSAMAWWDLAEATGDGEFRRFYERALTGALRSYGTFLPGDSGRPKVMDRLHAFLYFLEGMLPCAGQSPCRNALCEGIGMVDRYLREIASEFERSDVYAQLLRIRVYADWAGAVTLDRSAAHFEAEMLAGFQCVDTDPRVDGGYWFGRAGGARLSFVNPVSTAFALHALAVWDIWRNRGDERPVMI